MTPAQERIFHLMLDQDNLFNKIAKARRNMLWSVFILVLLAVSSYTCFYAEVEPQYSWYPIIVIALNGIIMLLSIKDIWTRYHNDYRPSKDKSSSLTIQINKLKDEQYASSRT